MSKQEAPGLYGILLEADSRLADATGAILGALALLSDSNPSALDVNALHCVLDVALQACSLIEAQVAAAIRRAHRQPEEDGR